MQVDRFRAVKMGTGETILYSGRDDDQHMAGGTNQQYSQEKAMAMDWSYPEDGTIGE